MRRNNTSGLSKVKATNRNRRVIGQLMHNIQKVASISEGRDCKRGKRIIDSVNFTTTGLGNIRATIFTGKQRLVISIKVKEMFVSEFDHSIVKYRSGSIVMTPVLL